MIFPFANWDQEICHHEKKYDSYFAPEKGGKLKVGKPCDMEAYKEFLRKVVERYDGDGKNDMPGLEIPIKYWEIMNEPSIQGGMYGEMDEELKFFVGTPQEYVDILKTSYETIKEADSDAKVLHAGMAGMDRESCDFWDKVFLAGAGDYFDIANIHSIDTDEKREDLFVIKFKKFLERYNLTDKPIWITEAQFGKLAKEPEDIESFDSMMVRSSIFSLALGAEKLFYIENWLYWEKESESTQRAYETLVRYINNFDRIEVLKEEYRENYGDSDGSTSVIGQYKIIEGTEEIYVLWGNAELPSEFSSKIEVTDIYGKSKIIDATDLILSENPIFVKLIN